MMKALNLFIDLLPQYMYLKYAFSLYDDIYNTWYRSTVASFLHVSLHVVPQLQCIPVMCLRGPCLLVSCNAHASWQHACGSTRLVKAHTWKYTFRESTRVEVNISW